MEILGFWEKYPFSVCLCSVATIASTYSTIVGKKKPFGFSLYYYIFYHFDSYARFRLFSTSGEGVLCRYYVPVEQAEELNH